MNSAYMQQRYKEWQHSKALEKEREKERFMRNADLKDKQLLDNIGVINNVR